MIFKIEWLDGKREPQCAPNPSFPNGIDVELARRDQMACSTDLPYPAKRCGTYIVECQNCGIRVGITTAGRADDPKSVSIPCKKAGNK